MKNEKESKKKVKDVVLGIFAFNALYLFCFAFAPTLGFLVAFAICIGIAIKLLKDDLVKLMEEKNDGNRSL